MYQDLNIRAQTIKNSQKKYSLSPHDPGLDNFFQMTPKAQATKKKTDNLDLYQNLKLLYFEGHYQENKKTTHRMRE